MSDRPPTEVVSLEVLAERSMRVHLEGSNVLEVTPDEYNALLDDYFAWEAQLPLDPLMRAEMVAAGLGLKYSEFDKALIKVCRENGWRIPRHMSTTLKLASL